MLHQGRHMGKHQSQSWGKGRRGDGGKEALLWFMQERTGEARQSGLDWLV